MITEQDGKLIVISILVGFMGDTLLQIGAKVGMGGKTGWGLSNYFAQHGRAEATYIAGGMMGLFYILYAFTGLPFKIQYMAIYGVILDLIFRLTGLFPSLKGYYNYFNYFWSAVWGAIPMILPLLVYKALNKDFQLF
jgi:hypothetical protein